MTFKLSVNKHFLELNKKNIPIEEKNAKNELDRSLKVGLEYTHHGTGLLSHTLKPHLVIFQISI